MAIYERPRQESTLRNQSVARAWPKIKIEYDISDQSISPHMTAEFERYKGFGDTGARSANDEPNDSDPPPTSKPSTDRTSGEYWLPWAELLCKTVGVDPEVYTSGARMIVDDAITDGEKTAAVLARLGLPFNGPTKEAAINGRTRLFV